MTELMKLSPKLAILLSNFEKMDFALLNEVDRAEAIGTIRIVKTVRSKVVAFFKPQKDAINKAKDYQKQWRTIGPVSSYQRNKLWKKFRKACDLIFAKTISPMNS